MNLLNLNLTNKTREELLDLAKVTGALRQKYRYNYRDFVFPATGKYSRFAYPKAMEFFKAGSTHKLRMFSAPNGCGKSFALTYELVCHLTGEYPDWWEGARQENPKQWWILVPSADLFQSSMQRLLMGNSLNEDDIGTGLIPKHLLVDYSGWPSVAGCVRSIKVRHKNGHIVTVEIKSTKQDREDIQAANLDGLLEDEEPPLDIHTEALFRLRPGANKPMGLLMLGYSPIKGLSPLTLEWMPQAIPPKGQHPIDPDKYVVHISSMDDIPHVTGEWKRIAMANCPPHLVSARLHGLPGLGSGQIYPYLEEQVFCKPFQIPEHWPKAFALDFGFHCTAVLWGAKDPNTGILYIYSEYYMQQHQTAQVHALNIRAKGDWIKGLCDPSGGGRQDDGRMLKDLFEAEGLDLLPADNSLIAGITRNCNMFENGTLKIFDHLEMTRQEFRLYRFDEKKPNEPARNQKDHAMDCLRYITNNDLWDFVASIEDDDIDNDYFQRRAYQRSYDRLTGY